ncbi:MAG TPA: hypothetical protein VLV87_11275 [Gammaproteobacteria bacterium]|nr:hypothetical protein [Gammaproteobacteria bacterium]
MGLIARVASILALGLAMAGCAQQPIYTPPYTSAAPVSLTPPLPVRLAVTYRKDGKRDPKREQELAAQLHDLLAAGQSFRPVEGSETAGTLQVAVEDNPTTRHTSLFAGFSAMLGHLFIGQPEFTPTGRRVARALDVDVGYIPSGGAAQNQVYTSALVTVTNNTQEPTDLVPMPDRKQAELALIGNDLNLFAAELAKPKPSP